MFEGAEFHRERTHYTVGLRGRFAIPDAKRLAIRRRHLGETRADKFLNVFQMAVGFLLGGLDVTDALQIGNHTLESACWWQSIVLVRDDAG